jgi:hypothetical protein
MSRTIRSPAGSLALSCTGRTARLLYATPEPGWRMERESSSGGDRVRVSFVRDGAEVRVSGRCRDGGIEPEVETEP